MNILRIVFHIGDFFIRSLPESQNSLASHAEMGRKRKAIAIRLAEGDRSKRGKHQLEQLLRRTPPTVSGLPDCPKHLRGRARETWERWRAELIAMQIDARCDAPMLERRMHCVPASHRCRPDDRKGRRDRTRARLFSREPKIRSRSGEKTSGSDDF